MLWILMKPSMIIRGWVHPAVISFAQPNFIRSAVGLRWSGNVYIWRENKTRALQSGYGAAGFDMESRPMDFSVFQLSIGFANDLLGI